MDYQVILSPKAVGDLETIIRYIVQDNPEAARKLSHITKHKIESSKFPTPYSLLPTLQ
ncbi:type II toxin-antitoxin system RelE/ParE family toxin [Nostoc sp.]|uniref:type II toxin-antitoxin system RelE/ParE family toxin n=1 Tax=Nostoc sp. TaxID=1180 RepID=UPI0039C93C57